MALDAPDARRQAVSGQSCHGKKALLIPKGLRAIALTRVNNGVEIQNLSHATVLMLQSRKSS